MHPAWNGNRIFIQAAMPPRDLLFRPVGVRDGFIVNSVLADQVFGWLVYGCASDSMRQTEVCPIFSPRAIPALLTPA